MAEVDATLLPAGKLRYANNSNYKNDVMIRKEVILHLFFCKGGEKVCIKLCYIPIVKVQCCQLMSSDG